MLFLLPAYLSENSPLEFFAPVIREFIMKTDYFFVENEKTARKVIKFFCPEKKQPDLKLFLLDKYSANADLKEAQKLMKEGQDFGLLSEAGLPCIADPGNIMVKWAHEKNLSVTPYTFRSANTGKYPNVKDEMRRFLEEYGVDVVFTDNPDQFPR